jgi:hypothetical protein
MQQCEIEIRRFKPGPLPGGWELFVDGVYAATGPETSFPLIEEMVTLHQIVARRPDQPVIPNGR